jgi:YidC/Oxa1 family membrane protein insertase
MMNDQKRMFLTVALSAVVIGVWQFFVTPQFTQPTPQPVAQKIVNKETQRNSTGSDPSVTEQSEISEANKTQDVSPKNSPEDLRKESLKLTNKDHQFFFTNILSVQNVTNEKAVFDFQSIAGEENAFRIELITTKGAQRLSFDMNRSNGNFIKGRNDLYDIDFTASLSENGRLDFHLESPNEYRYRFTFDSEPKETGNQMVREFVFYENDVSRERVGDDVSGDGRFKWFGLDYNFHLFSFVLKEKTRTSYKMTTDGKFIIDMLDGSSNFYGDLIFTKKNYDLLSDLGDNLHLSVDFGFFGIIAVPILRGLEFCYSLIPNYGIAIILLTIFIRLLTFPLQYKSFKSMKKMQVIQPELQKVREKFKDEPQKLQKETMDLFKRSGANPLGGCLPLIAQMPIFFAFYQVLYNAVELVDAPFALWIMDLSVKDPYYVLPVLMGAALFAQMKLNPTPTQDPMQKKVMMFMPLIFLFIMKDLPAGLNLYIFVSTVFGIIQQLFVYRMTD